jgi:hypothetical protein
LLQFWQATVDRAQLSDQLARDVRRLEPVSWEAGCLVLRASARDLARRVRRLTGVILAELGPLAPVPLVEIVIEGNPQP